MERRYFSVIHKKRRHIEGGSAHEIPWRWLPSKGTYSHSAGPTLGERKTIFCKLPNSWLWRLDKGDGRIQTSEPLTRGSFLLKLWHQVTIMMDFNQEEFHTRDYGGNGFRRRGPLCCSSSGQVFIGSYTVRFRAPISPLMTFCTALCNLERVLKDWCPLNVLRNP